MQQRLAVSTVPLRCRRCRQGAQHHAENTPPPVRWKGPKWETGCGGGCGPDGAEPRHRLPERAVEAASIQYSGLRRQCCGPQRPHTHGGKAVPGGGVGQCPKWRRCSGDTHILRPFFNFQRPISEMRVMVQSVTCITCQKGVKMLRKYGAYVKGGSIPLSNLWTHTGQHHLMCLVVQRSKGRPHVPALCR